MQGRSEHNSKRNAGDEMDQDFVFEDFSVESDEPDEPVENLPSELPHQDKLLHLKGIVRAATDFKDRAIVIENELGMDVLYMLVALGHDESEIASSIALTEMELNLILKQSESHRKKYMNARAFKLAEKSVDMLDYFASVTELEEAEKRATDFHSKNLDRSLKEVDENVGGSGVIINNILNIRDRDEIPQLPAGLGEILNADFSSEPSLEG